MFHKLNWIKKWPAQPKKIHINLTFATGFYCFQKEKSNSGPSCLGDGKGRTRKEGGPNFSPELKDQMYNFFKKSNEELFKWIGEDFGWN